MDTSAFLLVAVLCIGVCMVSAGETGDTQTDREKEIVSVLDKLVKTEQKRVENLKKKAWERRAPVTEVESTDTADSSDTEEEDTKTEETFPGVRETKGTDFSKKVAFNADGDDIEQLVETIRNAAKVNIVMDQKAIAGGVKRGTVRTSITLKVDNMTLESALNWICRLSGLAWSLEDEAIFITTPDRITKQNHKLKIYDIRDLSRKIPDFPGPNIELAPGESDINIFAPNN